MLSCGQAPDTSVVAPETQPVSAEEGVAPALDQDGPVEIENIAPTAMPIYVVTQVSIDQDTRKESGVVLVMKSGTDEPLARIASASISDLRVNEAGTEVTWLDGAHLHTYDVASGIHTRFGWTARP
jgi:hypothetical protein